MPSQWGRVSSPKLAPPRFRSSLPAIDREVGQNPVTRGSVRADQRDRRGEQRPIPELPERHGLYRRTVRQAVALACGRPARRILTGRSANACLVDD